MKVTIMPRGQARKIKGAICNAPIDTIDTTTSLPNNGIVIVKLKHKLEYNGHVYFESIRPQFINDFYIIVKSITIFTGIFLSI